MGFIQRRVMTAVLGVVSHPKTTLVISAAVLAASVVLALTRLRVSTDQDKLFSADVKFFRDYLEFDAKFPENAAIYVVIEAAPGKPAPPVERWTALADGITARLRELTRYVHSAECKVLLKHLGA